MNSFHFSKTKIVACFFTISIVAPPDPNHDLITRSPLCSLSVSFWQPKILKDTPLATGAVKSKFNKP